MDEQPTSSAERHFNETWLERAMDRMEHRLQVMIRSSLEPITHNVGDLKVHVTAVKEWATPREEDEQEDNSPLDSGWQIDSPAEPYPAMGRESRANPPQGRQASTNNYMGARSARFEQMDVDPPENNDREEPIITDNSHNVRVEDDDKLVNDSWRMCIEALFTSLNEAECLSRVQLMKWQEILMNFLQMVHLYKPSDGYKICQGLHSYTFGEVICKFKGLLVRLNQTSAENAAEGVPPAEPNTMDERPQDSIPPYGGTTYRFTTPQGSTCGQTPVWPGDDTARAHRAVNNNTLRAESSGFDGSIEENNPIWIIIQGALNDYQELNPNSEVFTHGRVKMPHPEYYSGTRGCGWGVSGARDAEPERVGGGRGTSVGLGTRGWEPGCAKGGWKGWAREQDEWRGRDAWQGAGAHEWGPGRVK